MRPFALEAALPTCRPGEDPTNSQRFGRELDQGPHGQVLLSESTASRGPMPRRSSRVRSNWTAWKEQIINAVKLTARRVQSFQACGVCHLAFGKSFLRVERSKLSSIGAVVCHEAFMIPARRTDPSGMHRVRRTTRKRRRMARSRAPLRRRGVCWVRKLVTLRLSEAERLGRLGPVLVFLFSQERVHAVYQHGVDCGGEPDCQPSFVLENCIQKVVRFLHAPVDVWPIAGGARGSLEDFLFAAVSVFVRSVLTPSPARTGCMPCKIK